MGAFNNIILYLLTLHGVLCNRNSQAGNKGVTCSSDVLTFDRLLWSFHHYIGNIKEKLYQVVQMFALI